MRACMHACMRTSVCARTQEVVVRALTRFPHLKGTVIRPEGDGDKTGGQGVAKVANCLRRAASQLLHIVRLPLLYL